jgi:trk system potassium uptake protein TrkH
VSTRAPARPPVPTGGPWSVDIRAALNLVGVLSKYLGAAALVPAVVALLYDDPEWPFVVTGIVVSLGGWGIERLTAGHGSMGTREGFLAVALVWLVAAVFGALPYVLSGDPQIDRPLDAFFESMSGFTTTGATVLTDIEALPKSLLFWRQFTQWLGGMGIIVLALAVLPRLRVGGRQLLEHEMPGPELEPLTARIRDTARRLWLLYLGMTVVLVLILAVLGWTGVDDRMTFFNAVANGFATLPTGGFSPENTSLVGFSAATQWVIAIAMILAGANYALLYRAFIRRDPIAFGRDEEFRLFIAVLALASVVITAELWTEDVETGEAAIRHAVFQAASIMTTTGFATVDYALWPTLALMTLVALMFAGASAGSTSGSVKIVRHLLLGKILRRELAQTVHPELVVPVRLNKVVVDERALRAASSFILLYIGIFIVGTGLLAIDAARTDLPLSTIDAVAASASALGNVGPGLGFAGPLGSFAPFSDFSNVVMIGLMWLGRLEVIPVIVLFTRNYWRK